MWCIGDAEQPADDGWQSGGVVCRRHQRLVYMRRPNKTVPCYADIGRRSCRAEVVLDALRNVKPVELSMQLQQVPQAAMYLGVSLMRRAAELNTRCNLSVTDFDALANGASDPLWFSPRAFGVGGSNGAISGSTKSKMAADT